MMYKQQRQNAVEFTKCLHYAAHMPHTMTCHPRSGADKYQSEFQSRIGSSLP